MAEADGCARSKSVEGLCGRLRAGLCVCDGHYSCTTSTCFCEPSPRNRTVAVALRFISNKALRFTHYSPTQRLVPKWSYTAVAKARLRLMLKAYNAYIDKDAN